MNSYKLLFPIRLFSTGKVFVNRIRNFTISFNSIRTEIVLCKPIHITLVQKMSQRSITSFFKITPPKEENKENKQVDNEVNSVSPKSDKKEVQTLEEQKHSDAEDSDSPITPNPKKSTKRKRIISSSSETDSPIKVKQEKNTSDTEEPITLNKTNIKTYESPKSKKKKIKNEDEIKSPSLKKKINNKLKVKNEKVSSSPKNKDSEEQDNVKENDNTEKKTERKVNGYKMEKSSDIVPEAEYNPTKAKYHPIKDACWLKGEEVPYLALAKTLEAIEATSARLKMVEILSNFLRSVIVLTPEDLLPCIYMCLNQLAPAYHSLELGIAETYLMKAIGQCTGRTLAQVKSSVQKCGDLGQVAEQARASQRTMFAAPKLKVRKVFVALKEIANMTGQASVNKKISKIQSLYVACRHCEARYLIRSLEGKLRIGLAEQSVLQALAQATATTPPDSDGVKILDASKRISPEKFKAIVDAHALTIKTTYCECPNYETIIPVLLQHGVDALPAHCRLAPGVPLKPMLAHPSKDVHAVCNRFEKEQFTCEWKYDGERAQIHVPGDEKPDLDNAAIFSRNQENNTSKYPDVLRRLPSLLKPEVNSCVLDCEAVAYDTVNKQILPFQVLSTRKRKDASEADIKVQVCVFVFDLLYLNGEALVREPLLRRRELLRNHFNEVPGEWQFATSKDCNNVEEVQEFLDEAVKNSCEGLMVKTLTGDNAKYDIARRSHNWLKLKKDYLEGVGDSIDAVVLGAFRGRGRRAGQFGGFLLACRDPASEHYQSLCKIGTGFSDQQLHDFTLALTPHVIDQPRAYYRYDATSAPDVWLSARVVWEIRCADLSLSPVHHAAIGLVQPDRGISLRFPRFIRVREDKTPEQATSAEQIAQLYLAQDQVKNQHSNNLVQDDFY